MTTANVSTQNTAKAPMMIVDSERSTKAVLKALGQESIKDLTENSAAFSVYANKGKFLKEGDAKTNKAIFDAINKTGSLSQTLAKMRVVMLDGIVTADGAKQTDPKMIEASKKTVEEYAHIINVMMGLEKDQYMKTQAAENGRTLAAHIKALNGNQRRTLFGLTVGVPMTVSAKNAFYKALNGRLNKGVKANLLTEQDRDSMLVSFSVNPDQAALTLSPIRKEEESAEEKARKAAEKRKNAIERVISTICELDAEAQLEIFKAVSNHSDDIALLMENVIKGRKDLESKVETTEDDETDQLVADARILKREIEQSGKGNKRPNAAQVKKMQSALDEMTSALEKRGVDVATL
ncbi:hypothetical protein ACOKWN_003792 [Vibrio parahaemolyticus]